MKLPTFFGLVVLAGATAGHVTSVDVRTRLLFAKFMAEHEKSYSSAAEENHRLAVFAENVAEMEAHNSAGHSYKMGINAFSDLTDEEFKSRHLTGYKGLAPQQATVSTAFAATAAADLPKSVDWREKGVVSPVKNQGMCGSCWAFATAEIVESYAAINEADGNVPILSTQQVTSCSPNTLHCGGTGGCYGSIPQLGYTYLQLFGHVKEDDYPYKSGHSGSTGECKYDLSNAKPIVGLTGYDTITNDQDAVMHHLAHVGPLAVAVDATNFGRYSSGVFAGCDFDANIALNHAVVLVGYGTDEKEGDYWIVRNSWGSSWGEHGYIRLQRQAKPQCGINSTPMDGTACVNGPGTDQQTVCGQCGILFDVSYPLGVHSIKE